MIILTEVADPNKLPQSLSLFQPINIPKGDPHHFQKSLMVEFIGNFSN